MQRSLFPTERSGSVGHILRGLEFALRLDGDGPPLTFGLRLPGDHALHVFSQDDVLELDRLHRDPPRVRGLVDHLADLSRDALPLGKKRAEVHLAYEVAHRRLRELLHGVRVLLDFQNRPFGVLDAVINHRIDLNGHVVPRDAFLSRDVDPLHPHVHPLPGLVEGNDRSQPRLHYMVELAEGELDAALVLVDEFERANGAGEGQNAHQDDAGGNQHEMGRAREKSPDPKTAAADVDGVNRSG